MPSQRAYGNNLIRAFFLLLLQEYKVKFSKKSKVNEENKKS